MKIRKANNHILPYPVLSAENEDVRPSLKEFQSIEVLKPEPRENSYVFRVKLLQKNTTINTLIAEKKAKYMFVLTCPTTVLQKKVLAFEPELAIEVDKHALSGHIDIDCYVVLTQDITYTNIGFADIYEGLSFDLEAGNILVRFPHYDGNMDLSNEKMFASSAFVEFNKSNDSNVYFDFDQDIIYISLPAKQYEEYQEIRNNGLYSDIIISSIVHEALMMAIISYDNSAHDTLRWADALNTLIYLATDKRHSLKGASKEERIKNAWEWANLVLKDPHERLFDSIIKIESTMNSAND